MAAKLPFSVVDATSGELVAQFVVGQDATNFAGTLVDHHIVIDSHRVEDFRRAQRAGLLRRAIPILGEA